MQDNSCHWYLIPFEKCDAFGILFDEIDGCIDNSDEWYDLVDRFNKEYSQYRSKPPHGMRIIIP